MKKFRLYSMLKPSMLLLLAVFFMNTMYAQFDGEDALIVMGGETPNLAEGKIDTALQNLGFSTILLDDNFVTDADAEAASLVYISATVSSGTVGTGLSGLADLEVPVINCEPFLNDFIGFTELDQPGYAGVKELDIIDGTHQMAANLGEGVIEFRATPQTISYGRPEGDVQIIAVHPDMDTMALLYCYEEGADMFSGTAPARRVGMFLFESVADSMNDDGWAIFEQTVKWAMSYQDVAVEGVKSVNSGFMLYDNSPNPVSQITEIKYSLPSQANVRMTVCNVLGETVATLVDGMMPAGLNSVNFDASGMPNGIYYYRLESNNNAITKSLLVVD